MLIAMLQYMYVHVIYQIPNQIQLFLAMVTIFFLRFGSSQSPGAHRCADQHSSNCTHPYQLDEEPSVEQLCCFQLLSGIDN